MYEKVPRSQTSDGKFLQVRWVDVNKGDDVNYNVRSRIVGKEFKSADPFMTCTFAATPPWECVRMLLSLALVVGPTDRRPRKKILLLDASRARFHPEIRRKLYIELPEEDAEDGMVGRLLRTMYGTRDAAAAWNDFVEEKMKVAGYEAGRATPCSYRRIIANADGCGHAPYQGQDGGLVHGDDFMLVAEEPELLRLEAELQKHMILKQKALLEPDEADDKTASFLNRLLTYRVDAYGECSIEIEPNPRHAKLIIRDLGLEGSSGHANRTKPVVTPGEKNGDYFDDRPLAGTQAKIYRSVCMRLGYLAQDAPHLQFAANKACKHMSNPISGGWNRLKRVARFLVGAPRALQVFRQQVAPTKLVMKVDSDWAMDLLDRKSTSATYLFHGCNLIRSATSTQTVVALSSGEAEFSAFVKGTSIGLGAVSLFEDLGAGTLRLVVETDSSAAKGIASRRGVGKVRHLHTPLLWVQNLVAQKKLDVRKIDGKKNIADLGTKDLDQSKMQQFLSGCGYEFRNGRHPLALEVQS